MEPESNQDLLFNENKCQWPDCEWTRLNPDVEFESRKQFELTHLNIHHVHSEQTHQTLLNELCKLKEMQSTVVKQSMLITRMLSHLNRENHTKTETSESLSAFNGDLSVVDGKQRDASNSIRFENHYNMYRDHFRDSNDKPFYKFKWMIKQALVESSTGRLTCEQILEWIEANFSHFKNLQTKKLSWKYTVGSNLANQSCFVKETSDEGGEVYRLDPLEYESVESRANLHNSMFSRLEFQSPQSSDSGNKILKEEVTETATNMTDSEVVEKTDIARREKSKHGVKLINLFHVEQPHQVVLDIDLKQPVSLNECKAKKSVKRRSEAENDDRLIVVTPAKRPRRRPLIEVSNSKRV